MISACVLFGEIGSYNSSHGCIGLTYLCWPMSVLARNAVVRLLVAQTFVLHGQQVVAKEKVTDTLVSCLQQSGATSRQAKERVRAAWQQALQGRQESQNAATAPFVGVFFVARACQNLGIMISAEDIPGCDGVIDVESGAPAANAGAIVPAGRMNPVIEQISDDDNDEAMRPDFAVAEIPAIDPHDQRRREVQAERQELEQLSAPVLAGQLIQSRNSNVKKTARVYVLERKVRNLQRQLATSRQKQAKTQALLKLAEDEKNLFELGKLGKQKPGRSGRWSLQSRFSMGLRCCLTTIAASDFGLLSMVDVSKQTVLRAECMTGASIIALMQSFCAEGLSLALECGSEKTDDWALFGVGYRSDATNSNIWHRKKLHVLEATVLFLSDSSKLKAGDFPGSMSKRSCVSFGC